MRFLFLFLVLSSVVWGVNVSFVPVFDVRIENGSLNISYENVSVLLTNLSDQNLSFNISKVVEVDNIVLNITTVENVSFLNQTLNITSCNITSDDVRNYVQEQLNGLQLNVDDLRSECAGQNEKLNSDLAACLEEKGNVREDLARLETNQGANESEYVGKWNNCQNALKDEQERRKTAEGDMPFFALCIVLLVALVMFMMTKPHENLGRKPLQ